MQFWWYLGNIANSLQVGDYTAMFIVGIICLPVFSQWLGKHLRDGLHGWAIWGTALRQGIIHVWNVIVAVYNGAVDKIITTSGKGLRNLAEAALSLVGWLGSRLCGFAVNVRDAVAGLGTTVGRHDTGETEMV